MGSRTSMVSRKNMMVIDFAQSRVLIDFSRTVSEIQNTGNSQHISPWKSYEHGFAKKCDGHKVSQSCARSRVSIDFLCTISKIQNTGHSQRISLSEVVRARFCEKM
ncbi:hypothetical protein B296_00054061 [Ensete ventricosum]|uniref:Uncharacterized protein n=1 Tax=Ensete ventricosum TaxID=4639 RepID=A0A426Y1C1_ENSVE|nr:hypothetical protein B296_00054061 [Ensete ventricosum]